LQQFEVPIGKSEAHLPSYEFGNICPMYTQLPSMTHNSRVKDFRVL
jgi:hypothetical protein